MSLSRTFPNTIGAFFALSATVLGAAVAFAADLPSRKDSPVLAPAVDDFQPFFVKLGVAYAINESSSRLAGPIAGRVVSGDFGTYPEGVGAAISNVTTVGFEAGYFITRNVSIDISGGIPFYSKVTTKGFNPINPPVVNGTLLGQVELGLVPITVVYHFDRILGPLQPYAGLGFAPSFSFANKDAFLTGVKVGGSVALILQAGVDYMIDNHWGVSVDAKKVFSYGESHATGVAIAPGLPLTTSLHTNFQPWLLSAGLVYRFGAPEAVIAKY